MCLPGRRVLLGHLIYLKKLITFDSIRHIKNKMSKTGLNRETSDKFYTKNEIAIELIERWQDKIHPDLNNDIIIEPSAGGGAFTNNLTNYKNVIAVDIEPASNLSNVIKADFLEIDIEKLFNKTSSSLVHTIGNPPFGRQSSLAKKFIKKCSLFSDSISFILPKSFKKESMNKVFPTEFHLELELNIPSNGFIIDNNPVDVPCVFQIWVKKTYHRETVPIEQTTIIDFVKADMKPDIALRRVGVYAGNIMPFATSLSSQSHYFIRFTDNIKKQMTTEQFIATFNENFNVDTDNTVGPKSISKQEFIREINRIFG